MIEQSTPDTERTRTPAHMIRVAEIFGPTIQGEGVLIGRPTVFVRTGGCDYRCTWCDSLHAVLPVHRAEWVPMGADEILDRVGELNGGAPTLITLSGGNPALQPFGKLIDLAHDDGDTVAMETQGSVAPTWLSKLDHLVVSPKPPSAFRTGTLTRPERWEEKLGDTLSRGPQRPAGRTTLKVVVFDEEDFEYACYIHAEYASPANPLYLSVGNELLNPNLDRDYLARDLLTRYRWLVEKVLSRKLDVIVLPQLHVLAWGNQRGV